MPPINPYDGRAAQLVPLPVERLPLFHWRPQTRLLAVGSRDGAAFDDDIAVHERGTYQRRLDAGLLTAARARSGAAGVAATWCASLRFPVGLELLADAGGPLVVATPPLGPLAVLHRWLPRVDAWLLMLTAGGGPLAAAIAGQGRHVEVVLGLDGDDRLPDLPWERIAAVHLVARRPAGVEATVERAWSAAARARLPTRLAVYDADQPHSDCAGCGARLVWRQGGTARLDALDAVTGTCRTCARPAGFTLA